MFKQEGVGPPVMVVVGHSRSQNVLCPSNKCACARHSSQQFMCVHTLAYVSSGSRCAASHRGVVARCQQKAAAPDTARLPQCERVQLLLFTAGDLLHWGWGRVGILELHLEVAFMCSSCQCLQDSFCKHRQQLAVADSTCPCGCHCAGRHASTRATQCARLCLPQVYICC